MINNKNKQIKSEYEYWNDRIYKKFEFKEFIKNVFNDKYSSTSLVKSIDITNKDLYDFSDLFVSYIKEFNPNDINGYLRFGGRDIEWKYDKDNELYTFKVEKEKEQSISSSIEYKNNPNKNYHVVEKKVLIDLILKTNLRYDSIELIQEIFKKANYNFSFSFAINEISENLPFIKIKNKSSTTLKDLCDKHVYYLVKEIEIPKDKYPTIINDKNIVVKKVYKQEKEKDISTIYQKVYDINEFSNKKLYKINFVNKNKINFFTFKKLTYIAFPIKLLEEEHKYVNIYYYNDLSNNDDNINYDYKKSPISIIKLNVNDDIQVDLEDDALYLTLMEELFKINALQFNYNDGAYYMTPYPDNIIEHNMNRHLEENEVYISQIRPFTMTERDENGKYIFEYTFINDSFLTRYLQMLKYLVFIRSLKIINDHDIKLSKYEKELTKLYITFWPNHDKIAKIVEFEDISDNHKDKHKKIIDDYIGDNIITDSLEKIDYDNEDKTYENRYVERNKRIEFDLKFSQLALLIFLLIFEKTIYPDKNIKQLLRKLLSEIGKYDIIKAIMHTTYAEDEFDKIDLPTTTNPYIKIAKLLLKYNLFNEIEICVDNIIKLCNDYFNGKESIVKYAKDEVLKFFNPAKVK